MAIRVNGARVHGKGPVASRRIQEGLGGFNSNQDSVSTAERVFSGLFEDLVTQLPKAGDPHPRFPDLLVKRRNVKEERNGRGKATITYEGPDPSTGASYDNNLETNPDQNITEPEKEIDTESTEEPIETHPNFGGLVASAGTGEGQAAFDEDGLFLGFGPNSGGGMKGVQSYLVRRTVTTETVLSRRQLDPSEVTTKDGNDLVSKITSTKTGNAWKNMKQTKTGEWNDLIYPG